MRLARSTDDEAPGVNVKVRTGVAPSPSGVNRCLQCFCLVVSSCPWVFGWLVCWCAAHLVARLHGRDRLAALSGSMWGRGISALTVLLVGSAASPALMQELVRGDICRAVEVLPFKVRLNNGVEGEPKWTSCTRCIASGLETKSSLIYVLGRSVYNCINEPF